MGQKEIGFHSPQIAGRSLSVMLEIDGSAPFPSWPQPGLTDRFEDGEKLRVDWYISITRKAQLHIAWSKGREQWPGTAGLHFAHFTDAPEEPTADELAEEFGAVSSLMELARLDGLSLEEIKRHIRGR